MKIKYQDLNVGEEFEVEFDNKTYKCMKLASIDSFTYIDGDRKGWTCTIDGRKLVEVDRNIPFSEVQQGQRFMSCGDEYIKTELVSNGRVSNYPPQDLNAVLIVNNNTPDSTRFKVGELTQFRDETKVELLT